MTETQNEHRRAPRFPVDLAVEGEIEGTAFEGRVSDVSLGGAAIVTGAVHGYQNDQFVRLHMQDMGPRTGYVRRVLPNGFAVQFEGTGESEEEYQAKLEAVAAFRAMGLAGRRA